MSIMSKGFFLIIPSVSQYDEQPDEDLYIISFIVAYKKM